MMIETETRQYTVKQLADLAGISRRTLHYYDEIGLLRPTAVADNHYRYYDGAALLRLQQILFYRELDFSLEQISAALDAADFEAMQTLRQHRDALQRRVRRLNRLVETIDKTILYLQGKTEMKPDELFEPFDEEKQKQYATEAADRWGEEEVRASSRLWNGYSAEEKAAIMAEGQAVYLDLRELIDRSPVDTAVQAVIARWHQHLRYFYEPTTAVLHGLAQGYAEDPAFAEFYRKIHPDMPEFLRQAIEVYCDGLE